MLYKVVGIIVFAVVLLSHSEAWAASAPAALKPAPQLIEDILTMNVIREAVNQAAALAQAPGQPVLSAAEIDSFVKSITKEELASVKTVLRSGDTTGLSDPEGPSDPALNNFRSKLCKFIHINDPFWCGVAVGAVVAVLK